MWAPKLVWELARSSSRPSKTPSPLDALPCQRSVHPLGLPEVGVGVGVGRGAEGVAVGVGVARGGVAGVAVGVGVGPGGGVVGVTLPTLTIWYCCWFTPDQVDCWTTAPSAVLPCFTSM